MSRRPHLSVARHRSAPPKSLDFWPTPHWVTRAMVLHVLAKWVASLEGLRRCRAVDPGCGEGAMVAALREFFGEVHAGDVFPYEFVRAGGGHVFDFADRDTPVPEEWRGAEWYVLNPPFNAAEAFIERALEEATEGVMVLHGPGLWQNPGRYERLWSRRPPTIGALFSERCNLVPGRLDPKGTTGRDYAVSVWVHGAVGRLPMDWIPPCRDALERREDYPEWPLSAEETPLLCQGGEP